jgi:predicted ArsR family transcriptional regulator
MTAIAGGRDEPFSASRRRRVAALLRHADRNVEEFVQALGETDNAMRAHVTALERNGVV